jgi:hypothetical protein
MDILEEVIGRLAGTWTRKQKDDLRSLAQRYLDGDQSDQLVTDVRAVQPLQKHAFDFGVSWVVFATWLMNRAGRFGQRLRSGVLPPDQQPEFPERSVFDSCALDSPQQFQTGPS